MDVAPVHAIFMAACVVLALKDVNALEMVAAT
jgi:hypothetical protein